MWGIKIKPFSMIKDILPRLPNVEEWDAAFQKHMARFDINTPIRKQFFLAQILHESLGLQHLSENLNYSAEALMKTWPSRFKTKKVADQYARKPEQIANYVYANRLGNGSEASGDGWKFRGKGAIQLTGKDNYKMAGIRLYGDANKFIDNPELLLTPDCAAEVACWYWQHRNLNALADAGDFEGVTRKINGGLNGYESRKEWLREVKSVIK